MTIEFTHWPPARERLYREKGYWIDKPLTRALEEQAAMRPDAPAILCGERRSPMPNSTVCLPTWPPGLRQPA